MSAHLYLYSEDLLARAAGMILSRAAAPDLSDIVVLLPDSLPAQTLQQHVARIARDRGHSAVLGLRITVLRDWVERLTGADPVTLRDPARQLLLVEALRQHADVFGGDDPWRVTDSLLELFDELTRYRISIPDSIDELVRRVAQGYQIAGDPPASLSREAFIVQRLWRAWNEQLAARDQRDPWNLYVSKLLLNLPPDPAEPHYVLVGLLADTPIERLWVEARLTAGRADWLLHGDCASGGVARRILDERVAFAVAVPSPHPEGDALTTLLDAAYARDGSTLSKRAERLARDFPVSPLRGRIRTFTSESAEHEARAIDLQVRRWLLEGCRRIGVVTADRRLARRVRALLERSGIVLADAGGWALSTTSAAACLERWMQTIEEDFAHQPLLDFLKSPFLSTPEHRDAHLSSVYRLERDVIQHENVARGLDRYRRHLTYRRERLNWPHSVVAPLDDLLDRLEAAARPLSRLLVRPGSAAEFLAALRGSLKTVGVWSTFETDTAGQCLLLLWEELHASAAQAPADLEWREFRIWLGRALESRNFRPSLSSGPVQLLSLEQSRLLNFDAVLIGACDRDHLPGTDRACAFFNSSVRRELGLPTWETRLWERLYDFRRLLESAPTVLLTRRKEENGEPLLPSPWVEALETLHRVAYRSGIEDDALRAMLRTESADIGAPEPAPYPEPSKMPRPSIIGELLPETTTASNHQHLIDCPYRYFISDCLRLSPPEAVRELLQKSDYGERVHRCLEAFHSDVPGLPGPFRQPLSEATRKPAIDLLQRISDKVFSRDLEDNFQHRGWQKRWLRLVPAYVDWQIAREREWKPTEVEARIQNEPVSGIRIEGRLDRIDRARSQDIYAVVDYKTGAVPTQQEIDDGEAVQLPIYALLLAKPASQVDYVQLTGKRVRDAGRLQGEDLAELRVRVCERIKTLHDAIAAGESLPAWGDPDTCVYCPMGGLCRRDVWIDTVETAPGSG